MNDTIMMYKNLAIISTACIFEWNKQVENFDQVLRGGGTLYWLEKAKVCGEYTWAKYESFERGLNMNQMDANLHHLLSSPQNVPLPQTFRSSTLSSSVLIYIKTMASAPSIWHSNRITGIIHPNLLSQATRANKNILHTTYWLQCSWN